MYQILLVLGIPFSDPSEGILNKTKPQEILKKACAVAALVASKRGATTKVSLTEINNLIGNK